DDAAADALDVNDAGIASQMAADPCAAIVLDAGFPSGMHRPIVECAFPARLSGDVAPPARLALYDRDIRTDVAAPPHRHPHVSRREACFVLRLGGENAARYAHTFEIDDRLRKHRKARRQHAVRTGIEALAQRDRSLVIDPAMTGIPKPGIRIFGRDIHTRR